MLFSLVKTFQVCKLRLQFSSNAANVFHIKALLAVVVMAIAPGVVDLGQRLK